jgi:hypothetical protein
VRYRALDQNGDWTFGQSQANFLVNSAACVAQLVQTRLLLFQGEWFLDNTAGVPYGGFPLNAQVVAQGVVLGSKRSVAQDLALQSVILATPGVTEISAYSSTFNNGLRDWSVAATIMTIFGAVLLSATTLSGVFQLDVTPLGGGGGLA